MPPCGNTQGCRILYGRDALARFREPGSSRPGVTEYPRYRWAERRRSQDRCLAREVVLSRSRWSAPSVRNGAASSREAADARIRHPWSHTDTDCAPICSDVTHRIRAPAGAFQSDRRDRGPEGAASRDGLWSGTDREWVAEPHPTRTEGSCSMRSMTTSASLANASRLAGVWNPVSRT